MIAPSPQLKSPQPKARCDQILPNSFDWRSRGFVSPVLDQEQSSSLFFALTAATEGQVAIRDNKLTELSVQQIIDCFDYKWPVNLETVYQYLTMAGGFDTFDNYPYYGPLGQCLYRQNESIAQVISYVNGESGDEDRMKADIINYGPYAVLLDSNIDLVFYSSGIFDSTNCTQTSPNQAMLVVGFGSEGGQDYWIVKSSWGSEWGEKGYVRLARNKNVCGIANFPNRPVLGFGTL